MSVPIIMADRPLDRLLILDSIECARWLFATGHADLADDMLDSLNARLIADDLLQCHCHRQHH